MDKMFQFFRFALGTVRRRSHAAEPWALLIVSCLDNRFCSLLIVAVAATFAPQVASTEIDWGKEQQFWSFQVPQRHCTPKVTHTAWPAQTIDFFTLSRLESNDLSASPLESPRELIRRIAFDL